MTQLEKLIAIRDRVKSGDTPNQDDFRNVFGWHSDSRHQWAVIACNPHDIRAMGAAKSLHEAVLPDYGWRIGIGACCVYKLSGDKQFSQSTGFNTPARAWLLAVLKVLIAEEQQQTERTTP